MNDGSYKVRGSFENEIFTYDWGNIQRHHFEIQVMVRIMFV